MFEVTLADIRKIVNEYSIDECPTAFYELQRYNYDEENKDSKEVRLIIKVVFEKHSAVVIRFKNERNVTKKHIEAQCRFAVQLSKGGIKLRIYTISTDITQMTITLMGMMLLLQ